MELRYAGDDKLYVSLERLDLVQKYTGGAAPALDKLGGTTWEKAKTRVKKAMRDMAEELLKLYAARKAVVGHAFSPDSHWQQEFGDAFEYDLTPDQQVAIADITRDLESPIPDGPAAVRRRRVRQDRSRDASGLQSDHGRQTGRVPCADDGAGLPALAHDSSQIRRLSGQSGDDQPLPDQAGAEGDPRQSRGRSARHHRRHSSPSVEGRVLPRSGPPCRGRGAALRRDPQGAHQADAQEGGCVDDDGHADSADVEHVARRHPGHVGHRDAAARPAVDSDAGREVRRGCHRPGHSDGAGARRPGVLRAQPRRVDSLRGEPCRRGWCRRPRSRSDMARWARRTWNA